MYFAFFHFSSFFTIVSPFLGILLWLLCPLLQFQHYRHHKSHPHYYLYHKHTFIAIHMITIIVIYVLMALVQYVVLKNILVAVITSRYYNHHFTMSQSTNNVTRHSWWLCLRSCDKATVLGRCRCVRRHICTAPPATSKWPCPRAVPPVRRALPSTRPTRRSVTTATSRLVPTAAADRCATSRRPSPIYVRRHSCVWMNDSLFNNNNNNNNNNTGIHNILWENSTIHKIQYNTIPWLVNRCWI